MNLAVEIAALVSLGLAIVSPPSDSLMAAVHSGDPIYQPGLEADQEPSVNVAATTPAEQQDLIESTSGSSEPSDTRYVRADADMCWLRDLDTTILAAVCDDGEEVAYTGPDCSEDSYELPALFSVTVRDDGSTTPPVFEAEGVCVTPADLADEARRAWRTMPIEPAQIQLEVERDWAIVNLGVHPRTTDEPQIMDTMLLGVPVQLQAVPTEYTWDPGDDSDPVTTTHPGDRYDSPDAIHLPYPAPGVFTLTLTTTWEGQFRITGTPSWTSIDGTVTTSDSTDPIEVHGAEVRLTN
jgi:hypothetical protein